MPPPLDLLGPRVGNTNLSPQEIARYSRHLIMPEVGMEGQLKLKSAKVLLIGAGGLGAPLGLYLSAAGVGRIGLVDFDVVDFTNLVMTEDAQVCELNQQGLHAGPHARGVVMPEEYVVRQFHEWVGAELARP